MIIVQPSCSVFCPVNLVPSLRTLSGSLRFVSSITLCWLRHVTLYWSVCLVLVSPLISIVRLTVPVVLVEHSLRSLRVVSFTLFGLVSVTVSSVSVEETKRFAFQSPALRRPPLKYFSKSRSLGSCMLAEQGVCSRKSLKETASRLLSKYLFSPADSARSSLITCDTTLTTLLPSPRNASVVLGA